jgi:hypothetical protein
MNKEEQIINQCDMCKKNMKIILLLHVDIKYVINVFIKL